MRAAPRDAHVDHQREPRVARRGGQRAPVGALCAPGWAWPVTNTTPCAWSRCVSGTPSDVTAARPAVMPLTTSHLDAGVAQVLDLLAAAAEDEGVAALEAHHVLAFARRHDHQLLDEGLRRALAAAALADVHDARAGRGVARTISSLTRSSTSSTVARLDRLDGLERQQFGVAGAGADQGALPCRECRLFMRACASQMQDVFHLQRRSSGGHRLARRQHAPGCRRPWWRRRSRAASPAARSGCPCWPSCSVDAPAAR